MMNISRKEKTFTMETLNNQLKSLNIDDSNGLSINDIITRIKAYYLKKISCYAIGKTIKCFEQYVAEKYRILLTYIQNNNYCYPIINDELKKFVVKAK